MVWHKDGTIPEGTDLVMVPGGFSYGDYLRCGAIAGNSPVISQLKAHAERGGYVLGVCNGFQILCETGLLPGALMRNASLHFVCKPQALTVETSNTAFTSAYQGDKEIVIPIAHHDATTLPIARRSTASKVKDMSLSVMHPDRTRMVRRATLPAFLARTDACSE